MMKKAVMTLAVMMMAAAGVFAQSGIIRDLSGTVELKAAGSAAFVAAKAGDQVAMNTIVSTGFKSTALISVGSASIMVRPLTRLTLADISAGEGVEQIKVNLRSGRIGVDVKPPAGTRTSFAVQSPVATASVRGTAFDFDTHNLHVLEGTVAFNGAGGAMMLVPAGSESKVDSESGKAVNPVMISEAALSPPVPAGTDSSPARDELPQSAPADLTIVIGY
jgi:hypothetical protein